MSVKTETYNKSGDVKAANHYLLWNELMYCDLLSNRKPVLGLMWTLNKEALERILKTVTFSVNFSLPSTELTITAYKDPDCSTTNLPHNANFEISIGGQLLVSISAKRIRFWREGVSIVRALR